MRAGLPAARRRRGHDGRRADDSRSAPRSDGGDDGHGVPPASHGRSYDDGHPRRRRGGRRRAAAAAAAGSGRLGLGRGRSWSSPSDGDDGLASDDGGSDAAAAPGRRRRRADDDAGQEKEAGLVPAWAGIDGASGHDGHGRNGHGHARPFRHADGHGTDAAAATTAATGVFRPGGSGHAVQPARLLRAPLGREVPSPPPGPVPRGGPAGYRRRPRLQVEYPVPRPVGRRLAGVPSH
mmetsp:Transcript_23434/g.69360  ORF Transcript_23434/g.69360 Transcript_23434/m.69360 type:complete len:236 (-) Transcript_23434:1170-1877(-)